MSIKSLAEKVTDNHYVLPKTGDMKTEVHAFLSEDLYNSSDEEAWNQIHGMTLMPGVTGAYLMPDCHLGYQAPIGSIIVTDDVLIQSCNGFDINCGIVYLQVPTLTAEMVQSVEKRRQFIQEVEKRVALGSGRSRPELMPKFTEEQGKEFLRFGAKALGVEAGFCERQYIPIDTGVDLNKIEKAIDCVVPQLGSVGGGNHFVELQCDPVDGKVWVMIHCGSRGYGHKTADYFFHAGAALRGLDPKRREESWLKIDEPLGKEYWAYASSAANFAIANRHIIVNGVQDALELVWGVRGEMYYEISHNLVQEETLVLPDGSTKKGFVHRKGATRAFPAGHPDLKGTVWENVGHPCLISGSMYLGAAVLFPQAGAYKSACSVNHGSGRVLGRKNAERTLKNDQGDINDSMRDIIRSFNGVEIQGILGNWRKVPLDECSHCYKDLDQVLQVLVDENIATIKHRLFPIANLKGTD